MNDIKKIHLIGIGGAGMSGIAEILINLDYEISGSDLVHTPITKRLESLGAKIFYTHDASNVVEKDLVVISSAISQENLEVSEAEKLKIPVIKRAEMLANLMMLKESVAIAGSHGKTTITCILAHIFSCNELDPTYIIGGKVESFASNAKLGKGNHIFTEADESDGSFLLLRPHKAVIANIDNDHLETYDNSLQKLKQSFKDFCLRTPFQGRIFANGDSPEVIEVIENLPRNVSLFGFSENNDFQILNFTQDKDGSNFIFFDKQNNNEMSFKTNMLGKHNILNAAAAITVSLDEGISYEGIKQALEKFIVIERRFQIISEKVFEKDIILIDDYGHHPEELRVSINTAKEVWPNRELLVVFQPHRYTRTKALFEDFVSILSDCKNLILMEIYPASEEPIKGYESEDLIKQIKAKNPNAILVNGIEEAHQEMQKFNKDNFIFLTQGAGNTSALAAKFKTEVN
jgi:UDP-N-acetylmuramate--alanine ligase